MSDETCFSFCHGMKANRNWMFKPGKVRGFGHSFSSMRNLRLFDQRRQVVLNDVPENVEINAVVGVC